MLTLTEMLLLWAVITRDKSGFTMFENASQEILFIGYVGRYAIVPVIKVISGIFMAISVCRDAKSRKFDNKWFWTILVLFSPILGRIAYAVYHRYIRKKIWDIEYPKVFERKGVVLMALSFATYGLMIIAMLVSMITIGVSKVKSKIDNEPIVIYYDIQGNQYGKAWKVPLYDRQGNIYKYEFKELDVCYTDQNGNSYTSEQCYIDSNGYFVYDEEDTFVSVSENMDYYKDAEGNIYYSVTLLPVYWNENGDIYVMVWKNIGFEIFTEEDGVSIYGQSL